MFASLGKTVGRVGERELVQATGESGGRRTFTAMLWLPARWCAMAKDTQLVLFAGFRFSICCRVSRKPVVSRICTCSPRASRDPTHRPSRPRLSMRSHQLLPFTCWFGAGTRHFSRSNIAAMPLSNFARSNFASRMLLSTANFRAHPDVHVLSPIEPRGWK